MVDSKMGRWELKLGLADTICACHFEAFLIDEAGQIHRRGVHIVELRSALVDCYVAASFDLHLAIKYKALVQDFVLRSGVLELLLIFSDFM